MRRENIKLIYSDFGKGIQCVFVAITALLATFIFFNSTGHITATPTISHGDKILHLGAYLTLGFFALPAFPKRNPLFIWFIVSLYGGLIEIVQGVFFENRTADIFDAIANSTGALLAMLAWIVLTQISIPLSRLKRN